MNNTDSLLTSNAIPVDVSNELRIDVWTFLPTAQQLYVRYLIEQPDGQLIDSLESFTAQYSNFPTTKRFPLAANRLISVMVWSDTAALQYGQMFTRIGVQTGNVNDIQFNTILTSGYIAGGRAIHFPNQQPESSDQGRGTARDYAITDPAAGAEISNGINADLTVKIIGGSFLLVADANAANRTVAFSYQTDANELARVTSRTVQTAGQTRNYILWHGPNIPADIGTYIYLPMPDDWTGNELQFFTVTANIQAGDQFTGFFLRTKQLLRFG